MVTKTSASGEQSASEIIRESIVAVQQIRDKARHDATLGASLHEVKRFQAERFNGTYSDLLVSARYKVAARFFLTELYGDKDFARRDQQFSRISGALQRVFPESVVATAVRLARLHQLTEEMDCQMAYVWRDLSSSLSIQEKYLDTWNLVGRRTDRDQQLDLVMNMGSDLEALTAKPGLQMMLRMMRRPARVAGLTELQSFLETGFDTFAEMAKVKEATKTFMQTIYSRESELIDVLFTQDKAAALKKLCTTKK